MMTKKLRNVFCCFTVCFLTCFILVHPAIADESANEEIPLNQYGIRSTNPYVADRFIEDGKSIDMVIVPSRPRPSEGFITQVAMVPEPDIAAGTNTISNVPAMTWCFGCSATSAVMMFGHYDNSDYTDMYTGPTNDGVFPMTNEVWGTVVINGETMALSPLSATRLNLDGRTIKGHVDDYWVKCGNADPDPFIGNWTEHTHGECTGDYMGTNQSTLSNTDGSTTFYYYTNGAPLYDYTGSEPDYRDGCHGLRLFAESRGYTVQTNFSQLIYGWDGNTQGFTFEDFKNEIDAGRPVLIQVTGHTMLGYGYDDTGSIIYIHDTWDYSDHSMTWGGSYSNMTHYGVAVLQLAAIPTTATKDELAVDFKTLGIYVYNTGSWNKIYQGVDPEGLCSFGTYLAADFGTTYGLYVYDAGAWTKIYKGVAIEKMAGFGEKLAVDFGTTYPIYEYNFATDTWSPIYTYSSPRDTIEALGDKLVVDFKTAGIYVYDAGSWNRIYKGVDPVNIVSFGDKLAIDFGTAYGLYVYEYDTDNWTRVYKGVAIEKMAEIDGDLAVDFGTAYGLYVYEFDTDNWTRVYKGVAIEKMAGFDGNLAVDFGTAYPIYEYNFGTDNWNSIYKYSSPRDELVPANIFD